MADVFSRSKRSEMMSRIRLHSPLFPFPRRRESLPANAGNSAKRKQCRLSANAAVAAEIPAFAGMEEGAGMEEEILWEMGSIADCLTLRRLRGGVKIRASEFLGGGGTPPIIVISPPPATASRSPPPRKRRRVRIFFCQKKNSHSRESGNLPTLQISRKHAILWQEKRQG